ncbi:MAG: acyl-CoA dehydrogenase [Haliea sp.]|nr:MAG: acyl-CoA dehydrogenase [Haliea sp.]
MSDVQVMIGDSVHRLFGDLVTREAIERFDRDGMSADLWEACTDAGLERALASEAHGGIDAQLADALPIFHAVGYHAAGVPLADTLMANWLLSQAGIAPPEGAVALLGGRGHAAALRWERPTAASAGAVTGRAHGVAWAGVAKWGVAVVGVGVAARVLLIALDETPSLALGRRVNRAMEPAADIVFSGAGVAAHGALDWPEATCAVEHAGALARAAQLAGALERVLELSVAYANERVQFGKPIGKNQIIQQMLAEMAGQVASSRAGVITAYSVRTPSRFDTAVAKLRTSEAAGIAASTAHQVHGAIGFTHEHVLHFFTRRLWSWRNEFGTDALWAAELGKAAIAGGPQAFWPSVVAREQAGRAAG